MILTENEQAVLEHIIKSGVSEEKKVFSMRKQMKGLKLHKRVVEKKVKFVPYVPTNAATHLKWLKKLESKGLIELDYTNNWKPEIKLTQIGTEQIKIQ